MTIITQEGTLSYTGLALIFIFDKATILAVDDIIGTQRRRHGLL